MKTPLKGSISISRYTGGAKGSGITISVVDELSGCEFVEIELTSEVLGNAITGASNQPCEFELRPAHVGLVREYKREVIAFVKKAPYAEREKEAREALIPYEIDGWKGCWSDLLNGHKESGRDQFDVGFHRFVKPAE